MIDIPILDRPLHAAAPDELSVLDIKHAGGIEVLQVLERVLVDEDQVGQESPADAAQLILHSQDLGVVAGGVDDGAFGG